MTQKNYEKNIEMCYNLNESGISSVGIILNYFIDKNLRNNMDEQEIKKINEYLKKFLGKILEDNLMIPVSVLNIIKEKNNELPFDIINFFIEKSIEKQLNNLESSSKNINSFTNEINVLSNAMIKLKTNAMNFFLDKCGECDMDISFPCVCYKCGHNYHSLCINANTGDEIKNIECPKCQKKKNKIREEIKNIENYKLFINERKNFESEYEKSNNKIEFILSLYGKGLFDRLSE